MCDCPLQGCNGTFRVSFDGEMSGRLSTTMTGTNIMTYLNAMSTIANAGLTVKRNESYPICVPGLKLNTSIIFAGPIGNAPRLGLYSSINAKRNPSIYRSNKTNDILRIITYDGRSDNVKICNGIGTCDSTLGVCECPYVSL